MIGQGVFFKIKSGTSLAFKNDGELWLTERDLKEIF